MDCNDLLPHCPLHGKPTKRSTCRQCNAAYMRTYLKRRRADRPGRAMWDRARARARRKSIEFNLGRDSLVVPTTCPVLGIAISVGGPRSGSSPSLDRIIPSLGYVEGNVRVISDRANRLKGDRAFSELKKKSLTGPASLQGEYKMITAYLEREQLLAEVRSKAQQEGRAGLEWAKIASFLDRVFRKSLI